MSMSTTNDNPAAVNFAPMPAPKAQRLSASALGESMVGLKDIAGFCGVTYRTAQQWRAQGVLPPPDFAVGKVIRWRRETVLGFVNGRAGGGG
jgi:hypothetical protein